MPKPLVAIVGRPNVGKSMLFNKLTGQRAAIVEDTPGVTRDRIYGTCEWRGRAFDLMDTGGIEPGTDSEILQFMRRQAEIGIELADAIIMVTDVKVGLTAADSAVATILQRARKPVALAVNKCDSVGGVNPDIYEFYALGLGDPFEVSAVHGHGTGDLLDWCVEHFPEETLQEDDFENSFGKYCFIDTAGMRRRSRVDDAIERYSNLRSVSAIERADVCIVMIDATQGVTEQDTKIAGLVHEAGKAVLIAVNKWDLVEKETNTMRDMEVQVRQDLSFMPYAPVVFLSALTGQRVDKLYEVINEVARSNAMRVTTGALNSVLADATARVQPPTDKGRRLKIYYMTQAGIKPPHFIIFCNDARLFHFSYQRYLENQIRGVFGLSGTPIRMTIRQKGDKEE